jgi:hypothetical protein
MAANFCDRCGSPITRGASFCARCGAQIGGSPFAPSPPGALPSTWQPRPPAYQPYGLPGTGPSAPAPSPSTELKALSCVSLAAILGLVGAVIGLVELFATSIASYASVTTAGSGTTLSLNPNGLYLTFGLAGVGLLFAWLQLWLYRQAFRTLAPHDARFSSTASLVLVALVALTILFVLSLAILGVVFQAVACAGAGNSITSSCINVGGLVGLVLLILVVAIFVLVGYIGLLIGIWRLGDRYQEGLFKTGAVLLIFPLLNVTGNILIVAAANSARRTVGRVLPATGFL